MSSRVAEKQHRRTERAEREEQHNAGERRARRLRILGAAAVGTVLAAAIAATVVFGGSNSKDKKQAPAASAQPFGQHYAGLARRRQQAGIPTMMDTMNSPIHYHPNLAVFVNGKQIPLPANIGIDPRKDPMQMAGLHTHDTSGTIHVEGAPHATLGKFFSIWGVPLSPRQLGPYKGSGRKAVRMWVNGKPSKAFGRLKLVDRQQVVVSYSAATRPPGS